MRLRLGKITEPTRARRCPTVVSWLMQLMIRITGLSLFVTAYLPAEDTHNTYRAPRTESFSDLDNDIIHWEKVRSMMLTCQALDVTSSPFARLPSSTWSSLGGVNGILRCGQDNDILVD